MALPLLPPLHHIDASNYCYRRLTGRYIHSNIITVLLISKNITRGIDFDKENNHLFVVLANENIYIME